MFLKGQRCPVCCGIFAALMGASLGSLDVEPIEVFNVYVCVGEVFMRLAQVSGALSFPVTSVTGFGMSYV